MMLSGGQFPLGSVKRHFISRNVSSNKRAGHFRSPQSLSHPFCRPIRAEIIFRHCLERAYINCSVMDTMSTKIISILKLQKKRVTKWRSKDTMTIMGLILLPGHNFSRAEPKSPFEALLIIWNERTFATMMKQTLTTILLSLLFAVATAVQPPKVIVRTTFDASYPNVCTLTEYASVFTSVRRRRNLRTERRLENPWWCCFYCEHFPPGSWYVQFAVSLFVILSNCLISSFSDLSFSLSSDNITVTLLTLNASNQAQAQAIATQEDLKRTKKSLKTRPAGNCREIA